MCMVLALCSASASAQQAKHYCVGPTPSGTPRHCPWELAAGLTGGPVVVEGSWGWHLGADISAGAFRVPWLAAGGQVGAIDGRTNGFVYAEVGFWLLLNLGVGGGVRLGDEPAAGPHLFLGLPVSISRAPGGGNWFVEPYYRPAFLFDGGRMVTRHEFGLMVKYWTHRGDYDA